MNAYISGGWKYLNEKTGEFFHDLNTDFRDSLSKILKNSDIEKHYEPRKWVTECVHTECVFRQSDFCCFSPLRHESSLVCVASNRRYGNQHSCKKLYSFVATEFPEWASAILPKGTTCLLT